MLSRFRNHQINWVTSCWLIGTFLLTMTAVPAYLLHYGIDWFQLWLFVFMFAATGFSITLGYHRLFSHLAFKAHWGDTAFYPHFRCGGFSEFRVDVVFGASDPPQAR